MQDKHNHKSKGEISISIYNSINLEIPVCVGHVDIFASESELTFASP